MKKMEWGQGPWAVPKPARPAGPLRPRAPRQPELEDVLNQKVKQHYGVLERLRISRNVGRGRLILVGLAVLAWLLAVVLK